MGRSAKTWQRWYAWHPVTLTRGVQAGEKVHFCYIERKGPFRVRWGSNKYYFRRSLIRTEVIHISPWQVFKGYLRKILRHQKCQPSRI